MSAESWRAWVVDELLAMTRQAVTLDAVFVLAERSGEHALADPHVWAVGGMFGVVVLAQEAVEARGLTDVRLMAFAALLLADPHSMDVARHVAAARAELAVRRPYWRGP